MNILAGNAALDSTCYPCVDIKDKYVRTSGSGFMVKTDNTAYQALVLVWLWCGFDLLWLMPVEMSVRPNNDAGNGGGS